MRALRWHAAGDLRLESIPEPRAGPGEALVAVSWCGICGTDLHEYSQGPVMIRMEPHPLTGETPPLALGHEFSGRVLSVGADVEGVHIGDRVVADPCWRCNECFWCQRGDYHICRLGGSVGLASDGALADIVRVPAEGLALIPESVDDKVAALAEPLAVGLHALDRSQAEVGDTILVQGAGPIGCATILAARAVGIESIHVSEPRATRRQVAEALGASSTYDPLSVDVRREVYLATGRVGPDLVFECTGNPALIPIALESARRGGKAVLVGIGHGTVPIDPRTLTFYERELIGSLGYKHDIPRVLGLMEKRLMDPSPMITNTISLTEAIHDGFDALVDPQTSDIKVLVDVGTSRTEHNNRSD